MKDFGVSLNIRVSSNLFLVSLTCLYFIEVFINYLMYIVICRFYRISVKQTKREMTILNSMYRTSSINKCVLEFLGTSGLYFYIAQPVSLTLFLGGTARFQTLHFMCFIFIYTQLLLCSWGSLPYFLWCWEIFESSIHMCLKFSVLLSCYRDCDTAFEKFLVSFTIKMHGDLWSLMLCHLVMYFTAEHLTVGKIKYSRIVM